MQDFINAMRQYGLDVRDLGAEGEIHRVRDLSKRKPNRDGWYRYHGTESGFISGKFGSWIRGETVEWSNWTGSTISAADRADIRRKQAAARQEDARRHEIAAQRARRDWEAAKPAVEHPYLARKAVEGHGLKVIGRDLIIPAFIDGEISSYQTINGSGEKRFLAGGKMQGASFTIEGNSDVVTVVEGVATGATIHEAMGWTTVCAFNAGNLPAVAKGLRQRFPNSLIVICGDNDASGTGQREAQKAARLCGGMVAIPDRREGASRDWNDVAAADGIEAVQRALLARVEGGAYNAAPIPIGAAQKALNQRVGAFFDAALDHVQGATPPVHVIRSSTGAGKSRIVRAHAAEFTARYQKTVAIAVPMHRLSWDQARAIEAETGLRAGVLLGRDQPDPDNPGKKMCLDLKLVSEAMRVGVSADAVCKLCPLRSECGYQRRKFQKADVWLVPHAALFSPKPKFLGDVSALILDESFYSAGLGEAEAMPLSMLDEPIDCDALSLTEQEFLRAGRALLRQALQQGPMQRPQGLDVEAVRECRRLEWRRKPSLDGIEADDLLERLAMLRPFSYRLPRLWGIVADFLESGRGQCEAIQVDGDQVRMDYRHDFGKGWAAPSLIIDATAELALIRPFLPQAEMVADIRVATPHRRIVRVTGAPVAIKQLAPDDKTTPERNKARANHRSRVETAIRMLPGKTGVICNVAAEAALNLPDDAIIDHFGNEIGRDHMADVQSLAILNATQPDQRVHEGTARKLVGWADPEVAAAAERRVVVGGVLQAMGRDRAPWRTADNPVTVYLFNDIAIPDQIDAVIAFDDLIHPLRQIEAKGVQLPMPDGQRGYWNVVAAMLPEQYASPDAARKDWGRLSGQTSKRDIIIEVCPRKDSVPARIRAGNRGWIECRIDRDRLDDISALVEVQLVPEQVEPAVMMAPAPADGFLAPPEGLRVAGIAFRPTRTGYVLRLPKPEGVTIVCRSRWREAVPA